LKLKIDEPLSDFAFNFKLRRYIKEFTGCCPSWGAGGGYYASMLGFLHGKASFGSREAGA